MTVTFRVVDAITEVAKEAWDDLCRDRGGGPFIGWRWLALLEETGCASPETGWIPQHLTLWRDGLLCAVAPAYIKLHSEGEFIFDWSWADAAHGAGIRYYPKLLIAVPFTPATGPRFLCAAGEDVAECVAAMAAGAVELCRARGLSSVHALFVDDDERRALAESGFASRLGFQFHWRNHGYASMADFLARMTSKRRNQVRREMAAPERAGIDIETLAGDALTPEVMSVMYDLYLANVDKHVWGRRYLSRDVFLRAGQILGDVVEVVLARERSSVRPIAGAFNFAGKSRIFGRYWGAFEDLPFLHFNVCYYHSIARCIRRGTEVFEPGAGGGHKLARGFEPSPVWSAHWFSHPALGEAVGRFVVAEAAQVEHQMAALRERSPLVKAL